MWRQQQARTEEESPALPLCRKPFERDNEQLLAHIRAHIDELSNNYKCHECEIWFQRLENLEFHLQCVKTGTYGFFEHDSDHQCDGHHHPEEATSENPCHAHFKLQSFLWNFEQAQLDSLIIGIEDLNLSAEHSMIRQQRWSWSAARRPGSRQSSCVVPWSFRSEPKYLSTQAVPKIGAIEQRLGKLSQYGIAAVIRRVAAENKAQKEAHSRRRQLQQALFTAVAARDLERVDVLLSSGAPVDGGLFLESLDPLSFLIDEHVATVEAFNVEDPHTPLDVAIVHNCVDIARLLFEYRVKTSVRHLCSPKALLLCVNYGRFGICALMMHDYVQTCTLDPYMEWRSEIVFGLRLPICTRFLNLAATTNGIQPEDIPLLLFLLKTDNAMAMKALVELGHIQPSTLLSSGQSPLEHAVAYGSIECAVMLLDCSGLSDATSRPFTSTAVVNSVHMLVDESRLATNTVLFNRLTKALDSVNRACAWSLVLGEAIEKDKRRIVENVLAFNENHKNDWPSSSVTDTSPHIGLKLIELVRKLESYGPPISFAAYKGRSELVSLFLSRGSSLETRGIYGSHLCNAAATGRQQIVQIPLEAGADPNASHSYNGSALFWTSRRNDVEMATCLVRNGADPRKQAGNDGNALICAVHWGSLEVATYLLGLDVDVNRSCGDHGNALCAALARTPDSSNYLFIVKLLLANDADPFVRGPRGTAIDEAGAVRKQMENVRASQGTEGRQTGDSRTERLIESVETAINLVETAMCLHSKM